MKRTFSAKKNCRQRPSFSLYLLLAVVAAVSILTACGWWPATEKGAADPAAPPPGGAVSEIPFATAEPEIFQAEFVITTGSPAAGIEKTERRIAVARSGFKLRYDYPTGLTFLQTGENETFLIDNRSRVYAAGRPASGDKTAADLPAGQQELRDFLTTKWLTEKHDPKFEDLGPADDGLRRYRIVAEGGENNSEILIYVDEKLQMPVRQEFYAAAATGSDRKDPLYTMELRGVRLAVDEKLFRLPAGYRRVSLRRYLELARRPGPNDPAQ